MASTNFTFILSALAADDLEIIALLSLEEWGTPGAEMYMARLNRSLANIKRFPYVGQKQAEIDDQLRSLRSESHLIYYELDEEARVIEVLRILHARMDATSHLNRS